MQKTIKKDLQKGSIKCFLFFRYIPHLIALFFCWLFFEFYWLIELEIIFSHGVIWWSFFVSAYCIWNWMILELSPSFPSAFCEHINIRHPTGKTFLTPRLSGSDTVPQKIDFRADRTNEFHPTAWELTKNCDKNKTFNK